MDLMNMQRINSVVFLSFIWLSKARTEKICTVGEPLQNVRCDYVSKNCPAPYRCHGGSILGEKNGHCCKDPRTLLCRPCIKVHGVYYNGSHGSSSFQASVAFRWENKECSESALILNWNPFIRITAIGYENDVIIDRLLNCKSNEKPCRKLFMMNVPLQNYYVVYRAELPTSAYACPYNEIANVSLTSSPSLPSPSRPPQLPSPPRPLSPTVAVIIASLMCLTVVVTVVVFWKRNRMKFILSGGVCCRQQNNTETALVLINSMDDEDTVMTVAMPEVGSSLLNDLWDRTGLRFLTVHQFQTEIFQNASEWMDDVESRYSRILILLTADLVNDSEDISNPLNTISRSLFVRLHRSVRSRRRKMFYVYLESASSISKYFHATTGNQYDLFQRDVLCKDFSRLASDLKRK